MSPRPRGRLVRTVVPAALCAAMAIGPLWGVEAARAITPEQADAAGYIPNPAPALATISVDGLTPRVLDGDDGDGQVAIGTESGVPLVTVSGTISNVGDVSLEAVDVRLQRGPRIANAEAVREPLVWSEPSFTVGGQFERIAEELAPGESVPYQVSMPATAVPGRPAGDLQLTEPGVYPLLVNVNGTPAGGSPARLDDARVLLPVLEPPRVGGPPGVDDDAEDSTSGPAGGLDPAPVPLTLIWPLASAPTRVAAVPGAEDPDPVVRLSDDSLPRELAEDGRLTGLVRAAEGAFGGPGGQQLRRATCLAIDPDLLGTVAEIADGRAVEIEGDTENDTTRDSGGRDGDGPPDLESLAADASRWLEELRALADGGCVLTLPAAQADLDAVVAADSSILGEAALDRADSVERILGVAPVPGVLLPASGTLTPETAGAVLAPGTTAVVAAPSTRTDTGLVPPPGLVDLAGTDANRALTFSQASGSALAATGTIPENPHFSDPDTRYWLTADTPAARLQAARAALLAPVVDAINAPPAPGGDGISPGAISDPAADQGVLAVPPQVWTIDGDSAASLLGSLTTQLDTGRMQPVALTERLTGPVTVPDGSLAPDPTGAADPGGIDPFLSDPLYPDATAGVPQRISGALAGIGTLRALVDTSDPLSAGAAAHLDPMVGDALRALSETGRRAEGDGLTPESGTGSAARDRMTTRIASLEQTVAAALDRVDVLPPGSVFTMASPNSPLLLVTRNALPFPVRVSLSVDTPNELHVDAVDVVQIPAAGSRTLQVPTQSDAEGGTRHTVTFTLTSPDGRPLSDPVELSVQSGGYPVAQGFAIAAAALALVLGGRRYLRYRRGILDPADEGHRP